ncbi:MAG: tryptophanyl-tRNA synthetase [Candidatus Tokpelaia sp. JSC161]|jgi:tryptophanyl-tRNA synthetase|nr:MAG: tryptophanyl-tRNA synthetase [Candidatus Tokpelaia sp. JSC161]
MSELKPLVFSGVQPTGTLHLGNYLGALRRWVTLQKDYECFYCVVDMHALTVNPVPQQLMEYTREAAAMFLAVGIDARKHAIFNQSRVFQHAELAWIFNCVARIGWMNRMTQFKDKAGKEREKASLGLFAYPSLMAADILVYRATHVPVGEDQKQHIELARDIAKKFNKDYSRRIASLGLGVDMSVGDDIIAGFFPMVEPLIPEISMRVMSLRDGRKKMSKSDKSDFSRINISDTPDVLLRKIRKAKTDSKPLPDTEADLVDRPEANNLVGIYAALANIDKNTVLMEFCGKPFSIFKQILADLLVEKLIPVALELHRLKQDPDYIDSVLKEGAIRASAIAEKTMKQVRDIVGFLQG